MMEPLRPIAIRPEGPTHCSFNCRPTSFGLQARNIELVDMMENNLLGSINES